MKTNKLFQSFFFFFLLFFPLVGFSQQAGYFRFISSDGDAQIIGKDRTRKIVQHTEDSVPVNYGDFIRTGKNTSLKLFLENDKYVIDVYPKTLYRVDPPVKDKSVFKLFLGKALFVINKVAGRDFEVKTKFATVGVKGTTYVVGVTPVKTYVLVNEGLVDFSNPAKSESELIGRLQYSETDVRNNPLPPVQISESRQEKVVNDKGSVANEGIISDASSTSDDDEDPSKYKELSDKLDDIQVGDEESNSEDYVDLIYGFEL